MGLSALTALVLSSMLGAGAFDLPRNVATVASPTALLIGWVIAGAGVLLPASTMLILTRTRPELDGGIFTCVCEGFDELIGFCSVWGHWLCVVIANVSYLVIVFSTLSFSTDTPELRLFGGGNTWQSIVSAPVLLWVVRFLVLWRVQAAASTSLVATLAKLLSLGLSIVLAFMLFKLDTFTLGPIGVVLGMPAWEQAKNTMLITLWVFIDVENAVVVSARVRNKRDVGRAALLAVLTALGVYLLVTLLSFGAIVRPELAGIRNPSMAGLMARTTGPWGEIIIAAGLVVLVCGVYLSWTIMAAEVPFLVSIHEALPRIFAQQNAQGASSASLWLASICVQICLVLIWLTGSNYNASLTIASGMILMSYSLVGAFLLKTVTRPIHRAVGIGTSIYGLWLLYTSGLMHLLLSVVLYAPGPLVFLYARKTHTHENILKCQEMALVSPLLVAVMPTIWMLMG